MARPKGYADWTPSLEVQVVLDQVKEILIEYRDYLPMTNRQIFYRLVGNHGYEKTEKAYKRLCNYLTRARRAQIIRFRDIRDDGINSTPSTGYDSLDQFKEGIRQSAEYFQYDRQQGQKAHVELWCEAEGMMPQMHRVSEDYGVSVYSAGGFLSVTAIHDIASRVARRYKDEGMPTILLHVGDYDPSGESIFETIRDDSGLFVAQYTRSFDALRTKRIALTEEQVIEHDLPTAPPKSSDSRTANWGGIEMAQAEAMPPDLLAQTVREGIEDVFDLDALAEVNERSEQERERLMEWLDDLA